jgi:RNA polymerase sigma-70 factor, ECF subfamily
MDRGYADRVRRFYEEYRNPLFTYALALCGSRPMAEDAIHEAFYHILRRTRTPENFRAYVFRAVRNATVDELRHRQRESPVASIFEEGAMGPSADDHDEQRLAVQLLEVLSADERECVVLKLFDGLTLREIAEIRAVSINTVASWYRRGIEKLRTAYHERQEPKHCMGGTNHA